MYESLSGCGLSLKGIYTNFRPNADTAPCSVTTLPYICRLDLQLIPLGVQLDKFYLLAWTGKMVSFSLTSCLDKVCICQLLQGDL